MHCLAFLTHLTQKIKRALSFVSLLRYLRKNEDINEELVNQLTLPDKVGMICLGGRGPPSRPKQGRVGEAIKVHGELQSGVASQSTFARSELYSTIYKIFFLFPFCQWRNPSSTTFFYRTPIDSQRKSSTSPGSKPCGRSETHPRRCW